MTKLVDSMKKAYGTVRYPNIRKLFIPDAGYCICDSDLDRADLQVVVWEAEDDGLKKALHEGLDLHLYNARDAYNLPFSDDEIVEGTETCDELKKKYYPLRQNAKAGCHATNYGATPPTIARVLGITTKEAEQFIKRWFEAHPGILAWHERTKQSLERHHAVFNKFGYRRLYFDRLDRLLPEALAWVPQSTVACVINEIWNIIDETEPKIEPLLQVHDSLVTQFRREDRDYAVRRLTEIGNSIIIPYDDPLIIPLGTKVSEVSWGDC